jgi:hypothetical protein
MTFEHEYRAEVVGDAVDRADARRNVLLAALAATAVVFLLLQAATNSWRSALALAITVPTAAGGALLASGFVGGAWSAGVLAAVFIVAVLALRQSLVLVRRAQALHAEGSDAPEALRTAVREQAPSVLVVAAASAALLLPAVVLGGAGLELLQSFAIALIGGLITSAAVVLIAVPAVLAAIRGLRPPPVVGPDTPDGELPEVAVPAPRTDAVPSGGTAVKTHRTAGIVSLLLAAGFGLTACQAVAADTEPATPAAVAEADPGGGPSKLTVTDEGVSRLGIETADVGGRAGDLRLPYAAVVYDAEGGAWTFTELEPGVYQRAPITISSIDGDEARLSAGPTPGTAVVTVGAAELVGVEAGISGGE